MIFDKIIPTYFPPHVMKLVLPPEIPKFKFSVKNITDIPPCVMPQNNIPNNQPLNDFQKQCIEKFGKGASNHVIRMRSNANKTK